MVSHIGPTKLVYRGKDSFDKPDTCSTGLNSANAIMTRRMKFRSVRIKVYLFELKVHLYHVIALGMFVSLDRESTTVT